MNRIPVVETLHEAIALTITHRRDLLRVGLVFIMGFFALGAVFLVYLQPMLLQAMEAASAGGSRQSVDPRLFSAIVILLVIEILLLSVFGVGWHRAVLIGPERGQGAQLGKRELLYFARVWFCVVICIAVFFFVAFAEAFIGLILHASPQSLIMGAELAYMVVFVYVFGRLGPSFAAISVDSPMSFHGSWAATRGNGFRILILLVLALAGGLILNVAIGMLLGLLGLGESAPYTVLLLSTFIFCVLIAVTVSINAIVFRRLTGWKAPA